MVSFFKCLLQEFPKWENKLWLKQPQQKEEALIRDKVPANFRWLLLSGHQLFTQSSPPSIYLLPPDADLPAEGMLLAPYSDLHLSGKQGHVRPTKSRILSLIVEARRPRKAYAENETACVQKKKKKRSGMPLFKHQSQNRIRTGKRSGVSQGVRGDHF